MVVRAKEVVIKGFAINTNFIRTGFKNLLELSVHYSWDSELQKGVWLFPLSRKTQVEKLLGEPISFDTNSQSDDESKTIVPEVQEKGKGMFEIVFKSPKFYRIRTTTGRKNVSEIDVPLELVKELWDLINSELKVDESTTTPKLAEKLMARLGITRFNREESGSFDWSKFFGTRGRDRDKGYFVYIYYPLKCLQAEGAVKYKGSEYVTKLTDKFSVQTEFKPIVVEE